MSRAGKSKESDQARVHTEAKLGDDPLRGEGASALACRASLRFAQGRLWSRCEGKMPSPQKSKAKMASPR